MNDMGHRIALEQVAFLEKQVAEKSDRLMQTRQNVLASKMPKVSFPRRVRLRLSRPLSVG